MLATIVPTNHIVSMATVRTITITHPIERDSTLLPQRATMRDANRNIFTVFIGHTPIPNLRMAAKAW